MNRAHIILAVVGLAGAVQAPAKVMVAPTNAPAGFAPQMVESRYAPEKKRDPFDRPGQQTTRTITNNTNTTSVVEVVKPEIPPSLFRLEAIVWDPRRPEALINGQRLEMNKPVTMQVGGNRMRVIAVEIGRERVVLDVEGQKVEVRLEDAIAPLKPKQ
jgi:hypothetical protein